MKAALSLCLLTSLVCACGSDKTAAPATPAGPSNATVTIAAPTMGQSFALTADSVDIDVNIQETNFTRVMLGMEGADMSMGQVRLYVDDAACNDPGEGAMPTPLTYNAILPNADGASSIGMDYCQGGTTTLMDMDHTLKAQLWHGDTALMNAAGTEISATVTFHTTFSDTDAGAP
ncbi:MAG TPA: hypothetical protein VGI10_30020 [Polyangiaceae bacterium]